MDNEGVEGIIFVDRRTVRFRSAELTEEIPVDRLTVELAEEGDRICFKDQGRPGLEIFTLDQSILENRSVSPVNQLREELVAVATRREISRRLRMILYFFLGCGLLIWLGSVATSAMVRSLAARVPPEWEQKFGNQKIELMRKAQILVDDSNLVAQLAELSGPLLKVVPAGTSPVNFYIAKDDAPNAFALPGGQVVVNTGLLRLVDTPEELLGVLAHELAHVSEKHIARTAISSAGPFVIFGVFLHGRGGLLNLLGAGAGLMIMKGFSQEFETEADDVGWNYLVAANIDPRGMCSIFRKFQVYEAGQKIGMAVPQAFKSHPALDRRITRLEAKWKRLPARSEFLTLTNTIPKPAAD